jgi:hypothetical protein
MLVNLIGPKKWKWFQFNSYELDNMVHGNDAIYCVKIYYVFGYKTLNHLTKGSMSDGVFYFSCQGCH